MQWRIEGLDRNTARPRVFFCQAENETEAVKLAGKEDLLVERIKPEPVQVVEYVADRLVGAAHSVRFSTTPQERKWAMIGLAGVFALVFFVFVLTRPVTIDATDQPTCEASLLKARGTLPAAEQADFDGGVVLIQVKTKALFDFNREYSEAIGGLTAAHIRDMGKEQRLKSELRKKQMDEENRRAEEVSRPIREKEEREQALRDWAENQRKNQVIAERNQFMEEMRQSRERLDRQEAEASRRH